MADVAAVSRVSYQTVSRVIHDHPSVNPSTRARVLAAIAQLEYRPNTAARALVTGSSRTLGIVALDTAHSSGLPSLYGIERSAREMGYYISVASMGEFDPDSIRQATARLAEQAIDGVLVIAPIDSADGALNELHANLPLVVIEGDPEADLSIVTVDQIAGAEAATKHLLSAGHETVFHLAGPQEWRQSQDRITGWRKALEAAGADVTVPLSGDWSAKSGYEVGQMLARIPEMTAVFVGNDQMALGMMRALFERGRRVPDDVCVVGFDDIPEAAYFTPPLTTVRQDFELVGSEALRLLFAQISSGNRSSEKKIIETELLIRESSSERRSNP